MKLLFLILTVTVFLAQATRVMKCWNRSGRCRTTCKENEVFYILCDTHTKCCVNPKYVPVKPESSNINEILGSNSAV
ncbi:beta-defensin 121 [Cynocephalus volans]|uniref:beta-defensin 121 n=1 Tax=Cynocephalus volans TaxID=110931 RepID=UPI002FC8C9BE